MATRCRGKSRCPHQQRVATEGHPYKLFRGACTGVGEHVPDEWECRPRLSTMLRAEAEKHDAAFSKTDFGKRDLAAQFVFAKQPAGTQHVLLRVTSNHTDVRISRQRRTRSC